MVSPAVHITGVPDTSEDTFSAQVTNGVSFSYVSRGSQWKTWGTRGAAEPGRIDMLGLNKSIGMLDLQVGSELGGPTIKGQRASGAVFEGQRARATNIEGQRVSGPMIEGQRASGVGGPKY